MFCSYVMGMGDQVLALQGEGFRVERDGENFTVLFPCELAERWEDFATAHLQAGYWNEYLAGDRVVFLFCMEDGIRRYEVFDYQNDEVHALCEQLCECQLPSLREMLLGNWFYRLQTIRESEKRSHEMLYQTETLYSGSSWLKKPVQTVMEILPCLKGRAFVRVLDLGCGVGRNAIAVAQQLDACRVDCVDLLETAIVKLRENAVSFGVAEKICGIVSPIEEYMIKENAYDLVLAVSALEHVGNEGTFVQKLREIAEGLTEGGYVCLIVNTRVEERDSTTGEFLPPQFEVNLPTEKMDELLADHFESFAVQKHTVVLQEYEIPRDGGKTRLSTGVLTYVAQKPQKTKKEV